MCASNVQARPVFVSDTMTERRPDLEMVAPPTPNVDPGDRHVERVLEGLGVAPGIAIGPVYLYARDAFDDVEERQISEAEVDDELHRFQQAVERSKRDLHKIASVAREKLGDGSADIFEAQAMMLEDDALYGAVIDRIRRDHVNADFAVLSIMTKHRQLLAASDSEYLRERANDMLDLQERLIRHLRRGKLLSHIDAETIVVAENLTAADIVLFSRRGILGTAMDFGGATSHVSIMARALGVPAVVSMHGITEVVQNGDLMILDGLNGRVILHPTPATLAFYRERQRHYRGLLAEHKTIVPLPAVTLDGHAIKLMANLEFREELKLLKEYGADGVGLFRTEILFLMQRRISLSEEEQFQTYRKIVEAVAPHVTTFRMLDLGGDKMLPMGHREHNPFLGWRGVRILLDRPEVTLPQLRAILRASAFGPVRILIPMVSQLAEVRRFKQLVVEAKAELNAQGHAFDANVPVGIMVEVPAVALQAAQFAREVDFFSIGTNDLTQYTLAVDRGNDLVASLYEELHPSVLSLIKKAIDGAHASGIPVSICGELAADAHAAPLLLGLGLDELSASPVFLPEVKRIIRAIRIESARELAAAALGAADGKAVTHMVEAWLQEQAPELVRLLGEEPDSVLPPEGPAMA